MKRLSLASLALVMFAATAHAAPGVAIRWNTCLGDGGAVNRSFACNTNAGNNVAVCSFQLAAPVSDLVATVATLDLVTAAPTLPAWWQYFNLGACRQTSLAAAAIVPPTAVVCLDWAQGAAATGISSYTVGTFGPSSASLVVPTVVGAASIAAAVAGQEYYTISVTVNNAKTVGTGSCSGCNVGACLALRKVDIDLAGQAGFPDITLTAPMNGTDSNFITWQGGVGVPALPGGACSGPTGTRTTTWGSVKALYR